VKAKTNRARTAKRKITTVGDILAKDDVQGILGVLEKHKAKIKDIVVVIVDEKDFIRYLCSVSPAEMVYLMEHAKLMSLKDDEEEG
jgi:hypothetical protein